MAERVRLHIDRQGEGPPLLLLHGFAGSARNFRPQQRSFSASHRVIAYDARGHARSEAPEDPAAYTERAFVADALRVLDAARDAAGRDRVLLGGLSMGAATALALARQHPERIQALLLASYPPGRNATTGTSRIAHDFADAIEHQGLEAAGARYVWGPDSGLDARGAALVRQGFLEHPPHGLANTLRGYLAELPSAEEIAPELRAIRLPTLVIVGAEDAGSLPACRALAEAIPGAQLDVIPGAGHVVNLAQPRAFDTAVRSLLARIETANRAT